MHISTDIQQNLSVFKIHRQQEDFFFSDIYTLAKNQHYVW